MYLWKTKDLAIRLKEDSLTKIEKKNQYIAMSVFMTLSMYIAIIGGGHELSLAVIEALLACILAIWGLNFLFGSNGGVNGTRFIERVVMLSLPILIKVFLATFLVGLIFGVVAVALGQVAFAESYLPILVLNLSFQLVYYWRVSVHLQFINR